MKVGVIPEGKAPDTGGWLLQSALDSIVFLPWSAGTMSHFERDLYETELPPADWQEQWWDYVAAFQGVTPPGGRDPELCDACTKTHINDDAAEYYDYALATLIKFQLHDHICTKILKQDVRACDYSGSKQVGDVPAAASCRWARPATGETVIKDATGEDDLAARADGVLRAAGRGPGEAQRRKGLRALMATKDEGLRVSAARVAPRRSGRAAALRARWPTVCARGRSIRSATWNARRRR